MEKRSAGDVVAINTPDKPKVKPVDLMDASWAKAPVGYEKSPARSAENKQQAVPAKEKSSPQVAPGTPTPGPIDTKVRPDASAPHASEVPQAIITAVDTPVTAQAQDQSAPLRAETYGLPKSATIAAAPALNASFLTASDIPSWARYQNIEKIDPAAAETQRQREKAMTAGLIDNGFISQSIAAINALPGDTDRVNKEREKDQEREREKNRNILSSISLDVFAENVRQTIIDLETSIEEARTLRSRLSNELSDIRTDIKNTAIQIAASEQKVSQLEGQKAYGQFKMQAYYNDYSTLHEEYQRKSEEDRQKFGDNRNPQDAELHQKAWEENRNKVELLYKQKGLEEEFKILEKVKNGESVDQKAFDQAMEKIREKDITLSTLDMAMLKVDKGNEYFKTTSGLSVRMMEKTMRLHQVDKGLEKNQQELTEELDKLKAFRERMDDLKKKEKVTEEQIAKVDEFIELKNEQLKRAKELERKISDPEFQKRYDEGKISREEYESHLKELVQLKRDIHKTDREFGDFVKENWPNYSRNKTASASMTPATGTRQEMASEPPAGNNTYARTTTDSAAGLVEGSPIAQADGKLKGSFTVAAAGTTQSETPDLSVTADVALAAEQQRRAPVTTLGA